MNVVFPRPDSPATLFYLAFSLCRLSSQRVAYHYCECSSPLGDNLMPNTPPSEVFLYAHALIQWRTSGWEAEQMTVSIGCYDL